MPVDVTATSSEKHEEYDHRVFADLTEGFAAATTNRRVGRCIRKPPGPSVDDGPGENSCTEESPEDLGAALIEQVQATLKTRKGFDDLGQALADQPVDAFAPEELARLNRTIKQLDDEHVFEAQVIAIPRGKNHKFAFPSGGSASVALANRQNAIGLGYAGKRVIAVAADLPFDSQKDTVLRILSEDIEAIAAENGFHPRPDSIFKWLQLISGMSMG